MMKASLATIASLPATLQGRVLFISDRAGFVNPDLTSPTTARKVSQGVCFLDGTTLKPITPQLWKNTIEDKSIAVLIHGYNKEYSEAIDFCRNIIEQTHHLYDVFVCYLWPSGNQLWEYHEARTRVVNSLPRRLLTSMKTLTRFGESVDIIAHSMGCRLTLEMLQEPSNVLIRNAFFLAPAVDNESLEKGEAYYISSQKCESIFIFYSKNDAVLKWAYPLGEWDQALGYSGTESIRKLPKNIFQINYTRHIPGHSHYSDSNAVFDLIENILQAQKSASP